MPPHSTLHYLTGLAELLALATAAVVAACALALLIRTRARKKRIYVRLRVTPYRGDDPTADAIVRMYETLHKRLLRRWWRRIFGGQPSVALEIHFDRVAWFSLTCPSGLESMVESALRTAYPNVEVERGAPTPASPPYVLRLKKHAPFTERAKRIDRFEHDRLPPVNGVLTAMAACQAPGFVQIALTPAPTCFESHAKRAYKRHENHLSRKRKLSFPVLDPSRVEAAELVGGLDVQHRPLFFTDVRIVAAARHMCEQIASELRATGAENRLVERGTSLRHGLLGLYTRRILRGEGNPLPSYRKGVFACTELAAIWHLPSPDYSTVPVRRHPLPLAPAPPAIMRPTGQAGTLQDLHGPVTIHPSLRDQNTAVCGAMEQGKSSYLVATVADDLARERCAVIVFDPKGSLAEAAVSVVPEDRTCTLLDLADPSFGFHSSAVNAAVNETGRLLNSPLVTSALLNGSPRLSFDEVIANGEVLVVKGAVGSMGARNTSLVMQLLVAMLAAALARRHDGRLGQRPTPVALKLDDAPLILDRSLIETLALKGATGLETVACWQADSQWTDREIRAQLDALFAHRVYFATPSPQEARNTAKLTMAEFSDVVRPDIRNLSALGRPDLRLHLPRHIALVSWITPEGRQAPFVARTLPIQVDVARLAHHAARQAERESRYRA